MKAKWTKMKRRWIQVICAVLYNCHITGFADGTIYQGNIKGICVPGLNCYSCPGTVFACPLGSLQSALVSSKYRFPYYILGVLLLFGIFLGRIICGFLCPFGLLQELLYKIPTRKLPKSILTRRLSFLKYIILAVFVVLIPLVFFVPGFCKYILLSYFSLLYSFSVFSAGFYVLSGLFTDCSIKYPCSAYRQIKKNAMAAGFVSAAVKWM